MICDMTLECKNAAFEGNETGEVTRILRALADRLDETGIEEVVLFDVNGNRVGLFRWTN